MSDAYLIKAYADNERQLKERERIVRAESELQAKVMAFKMFPQYKEIGVYLLKEKKNDK